MGMLTFVHGPVSTGKTLALINLAQMHHFDQRSVVLIKPRIDNRFGEEIIQSRTGLSAPAKIVLDKKTRLDTLQSMWKENRCILVDEVQFLTTSQIEELRHISVAYKIHVICFGLLTDSKTDLFPGSQRLVELADELIPGSGPFTPCSSCSRRATHSLRLLNGKPTLNGPQVEIGADNKYTRVCYPCYEQRLGINSIDEMARKRLPAKL